jgi:hypothetical protein
MNELIKAKSANTHKTMKRKMFLRKILHGIINLLLFKSKRKAPKSTFFLGALLYWPSESTLDMKLYSPSVDNCWINLANNDSLEYEIKLFGSSFEIEPLINFRYSVK